MLLITRWALAGAILALAVPPLGAQDTKVRTIGAGMDDSIIRITSADVPNRREDSRGLLINDTGVILTAWRNVCMGTLQVSVAHSSVNAKLIGVHPNRDLAIIQADLSGVADKAKIKPATLASSSLGLGDQIFLWRYQNPVPAVVSSETQPSDHPEYFWMTGKDTLNSPAFMNGWGNMSPSPDDWVLNLKGEIQGMLARVIVNGAMTLRVIPVHDVRVEDFIPPSQRRTDPAKARELLLMAETVERDRYKPQGRIMGPGSWTGGTQDYLRLALAEDPTNKDVLFKMGLTADDVKTPPNGGGGASEPRKAPDPAAGKSSEQVETEFIRSRVNTAMELLKSNQIKIAQGILQDVVDTYPKHPEAKTAQRLLDVLKGKK